MKLYPIDLIVLIVTVLIYGVVGQLDSVTESVKPEFSSKVVQSTKNKENFTKSANCYLTK